MAERTNKRRPGSQLSPLDAAYAKCRSALFYTMIFSCVVNILMLTGPLFMMQVYDRVLTSRSIDTLVALSVLTAALYAVSGVLELIRARLMTRVGARIDADLRSLTFSRVVEHAIRHTPNVGTQPIRDLDAIRQFAASPAPFSLLDMPWAPLYLGVTYLIHPMLAALAFGGAVILFSLALFNEISSRKGGTQGAAGTMKAHLLAEQATGGAEILRGMGMENAFGAVWSRNYEAGADYQRLAADRNGIFSSATKTIRMILQSAVLALGAYLVIFNEITPGSMIAASIITARALAPVEQAIGHWRSFLSYRQSKRRLEQVLGELEGAHERMTLPAPKGAVSVEGVAIVPPRSGKPLLQGLQFALRPGEGLGVIGPTGAGKSSLARTMIGVWPAAKGTVRLDGAALEQYPPEQLGRAVGYLPQDVILFPGTIQENIARFAPDASSEAVVKAAQAAKRA